VAELVWRWGLVLHQPGSSAKLHSAGLNILFLRTPKHATERRCLLDYDINCVLVEAVMRTPAFLLFSILATAS
jgi:hypothetical protein